MREKRTHTAAPHLEEIGGVLVLTDGVMQLSADFTESLNRLRPANLKGELLIRAAKKKDGPDAPLAVDATAGLGEDSLLLAAAGFRVDLYERDPVIAALLRDALKRAAGIPELAEAVSRMRLFEEDSLKALACLPETPELILLDPMFPERRKKALVHKKFQLLQQLESPCSEEEGEQLLQAAAAAGPRKVIIKRPLKGPYLGGKTPSYSIAGKTVRYDCIVCSAPGL